LIHPLIGVIHTSIATEQQAIFAICNLTRIRRRRWTNCHKGTRSQSEILG